MTRSIIQVLDYIENGSYYTLEDIEFVRHYLLNVVGQHGVNIDMVNYYLDVLEEAEEKLDE